MLFCVGDTSINGDVSGRVAMVTYSKWRDKPTFQVQLMHTVHDSKLNDLAYSI